VYDFILKCEEILKRSDEKRSREEALQERALRRQYVMLDRLNKQRRGESVPIQIPLPSHYRDTKKGRAFLEESDGERQVSESESE